MCVTLAPLALAMVAAARASRRLNEFCRVLPAKISSFMP
jgi:hypothetical protein